MKPTFKKHWLPLALGAAFIAALARQKYQDYDPGMNDDPVAVHRAKLKAAAGEAVFWGCVFGLIVFVWKALLEP